MSRRVIKLARLTLTLTLTGMVILLAVGCGGPRDEVRHPRHQRAMRLRDEGKFAAAAEELEEYLRRYPPADTQVHLALAKLYHDHLDQPFLAVYHYRRHLELHPGTADQAALQAWCEAAEKRYYELLSTRFSPDLAWRDEALRLRGQLSQARQGLERLLSENRYLKEQSGIRVEATTLATLPVAPVAVPVVPIVLPVAPVTLPAAPVARVVAPPPVASPPSQLQPSPVPEPTSSPKPTTSPRTYVVRDGDTLARISREVYGSANHYQLIFDANQDQLASAGELQVGQSLRIPPLPTPERR